MSKEEKPRKIKVRKLKLSKEAVTDLSEEEAKRINGGFGSGTNIRDDCAPDTYGCRFSNAYTYCIPCRTVGVQ